jgi:hypothetical protein
LIIGTRHLLWGDLSGDWAKIEPMRPWADFRKNYATRNTVVNHMGSQRFDAHFLRKCGRI